MNERTLMFWSVLTGLSTVVLIVLWIVFGLAVADRFSQVNNLWREYDDHATQVSDSLTHLKSSIGYGGFIHNFKNYVLRQSTEYEQRVINQIESVSVAIAQVKQHLQTPPEHAALASVEDTFQAYFAKFAQVQQLVAEGRSPPEIDRIVKVDDSLALHALEQLRRIMLKRSDQIHYRTSAELNAAIEFMNRALWASAILVFISALMIVLIRKVYVAYLDVQQTRDQLASLYQTAPDAMLTVDQSGTIIKANDKAEEFFEYTADELIGMSVETLLPEEARQQHIAHRASYNQAPSYRPMGSGLELHALTKSGGMPNVEISLSNTDSPNGTYTTVSVRDVTEAVKLQQELAIARAREKQLSTAKSRLISNMSHEMRTPLNHIIGFGELLAGDAETILSQEHKDYLNHILTAAKHELELINTVLEFANFDVHAVSHPSTFTPRDEVDTSLALFSDAAAAKGLTLRAEIDGDVPQAYPGNAVLIGKILTALISNAMKFNTTPDGYVLVCASSKDDKIRFCVEDDGPGISQEDRKRVFDPFERLNAQDEAIEGIGFGLTAAEEFVKSMGGEIWIDDTETGTRVCFTI